MELPENITKKYPKSVTGLQCIGPCYESNTVAVHPISLNIITSNNNFCPTNESITHDKFDENGTNIGDIDKCYIPTTNENSNSKELGISIINPYIDFSPKFFLWTYYNIRSFDEAMNWLDENNYAPLENKIRIVKTTLSAYVSNIEIMDQRFIDFFIILIKKKYISEIYNNIYNYIGKKNDSIIFMNPKNNKLEKKELLIERINFIVKLFVNIEESQKFLIRYFKYKKDLVVLNYIDDIINEFIQYILTKIKKSI